VGLLLGLLVAQAAVGYLQYFNDLPALLVGVHVAGATAVFSAAVGVLLGCRTPDPAPAPVPAPRDEPAVPVA
jgi:cytochrome c oxidase assembly protein subunit 15